MPEGHSVHRIARQFSTNFVSKRVSVSSPQGRFVEGATVLDGRVLLRVFAVGKQMFAEFTGGVWLRVHLGLYGAWDFAGEITTDPTIASAQGRMGQTQQRGTTAHSLADRAGEDSVGSIGAPRVARMRMSEQSRSLAGLAEGFPPEPIGQVRVRLLTDDQVADLRGPTACEVTDEAGVQRTIDRLGPDPLNDDGAEAERAFAAAVQRRRTPIALLLMDQSVVSGIGNVYRAELLFRQRLNPYTHGAAIDDATASALWTDWSLLLRIGVETGQMMTMDDLDDDAYAAAMASLEDRHWVYKREGKPCRVCGTAITLEELAKRKLYWCPSCQSGAS